MIITFTGFQNRKNKSSYATALVSTLCSLTKGTKTLVLQLGEKDVESVEYFLTGAEEVKAFVDKGLTFTNEGIDGLIRTADSIKLKKEDFDQMCLSLRKDNRLDIAEMAKNTTFVSTLNQRLDSIKQILRNASEVYDDIFVLLPYTNEEVVKELNELEIVGKSVYCVKQGPIKPGNIYGSNPVVLVMDYDEDSVYTVKHMKNALKLGKNAVIKKINYNTKAKDAARSNQLLGFVAQNRDLDKEDINYRWLKDLRELLSVLLDTGEADLEVNYEWEKLNPFLTVEQIAKQKQAKMEFEEGIRAGRFAQDNTLNPEEYVTAPLGKASIKKELPEENKKVDAEEEINHGSETLVKGKEPVTKGLFSKLFGKKEKPVKETSKEVAKSLNALEVTEEPIATIDDILAEETTADISSEVEKPQPVKETAPKKKATRKKKEVETIEAEVKDENKKVVKNSTPKRKTTKKKEEGVEKEPPLEEKPKKKTTKKVSETKASVSKKAPSKTAKKPKAVEE